MPHQRPSAPRTSPADSGDGFDDNDTDIAAVASAIAAQTAAATAEAKRATDLEHARSSIGLLLQHRNLLSEAQNLGLTASLSTMLTNAVGVLGVIPEAPRVRPSSSGDDSLRPRQRMRAAGASGGPSDASGVDEPEDGGLNDIGGSALQENEGMGEPDVLGAARAPAWIAQAQAPAAF